MVPGLQSPLATPAAASISALDSRTDRHPDSRGAGPPQEPPRSAGEGPHIVLPWGEWFCVGRGRVGGQQLW